MNKLIFFDTETTDLKPGQIAQLSYIIADSDLQITQASNYYFEVEQMSPGASQVNGLTLEKLRHLSQGSRFEHHASEILRAFHHGCMAAHNVRFDISFMSAEFRRLGVHFPSSPSFCTMNYFKPLCALPGRYNSYKNPRLEEVLRFLNISNQEIRAAAQEAFGKFTGGFHDSRYDTTGVYLIYKTAVERGLIG